VPVPSEWPSKDSTKDFIRPYLALVSIILGAALGYLLYIRDHRGHHLAHGTISLSPSKDVQSAAVRDGQGASGRLTQDFTSVYLTLVSIILGAAFAYLALVIHDQGQTFPWQVWMNALTAFLVIVIVWHEYMTGATLLNWVPTIWDSTIPFVVGLAIYNVIKSITAAWTHWFISLSALSFATTIAAAYLQYKAGKERPTNRDVLRGPRATSLSDTCRGGVLGR
jgi:hypothetical protein